VPAGADVDPAAHFHLKRYFVLLEVSRRIVRMASPFLFDFDLLASFVAWPRTADLSSSRHALSELNRPSAFSSRNSNLKDRWLNAAPRELQLTSDGEMPLVFARRFLNVPEILVPQFGS